MDTARLENLIAERTDRSYAIAVGRAAWGLAILLFLWREPGRKQRIAMPSFLCQSPLSAVLMAGWDPFFCDVNPETGNVSMEEWARAIAARVDAILFPHLFGNVGNALEISERSRKEGIYFIEDAAQSFGGDWNGTPSGAFGDAALVSFGHTKLIDAGHGGMVVTNDRSLAEAIRGFDSRWAFFSDRASAGSGGNFRERFYKARHLIARDEVVAREGFKGLLRQYDSEIPTRWRPSTARIIGEHIDMLDVLIRQRREKNELYVSMLARSALVTLDFSAGSVPWRAAFRLPGARWETQERISERVRAEGVEISNWYIPAQWLLDDPNEFGAVPESTLRLSQEIFQLWLDSNTSMERIEENASVLVRALERCAHG